MKVNELTVGQKVVVTTRNTEYTLEVVEQTPDQRRQTTFMIQGKDISGRGGYYFQTPTKCVLYDNEIDVGERLGITALEGERFEQDREPVFTSTIQKVEIV